MPVDEGLSTHNSLDRFQYVMSTWIDTDGCDNTLQKIPSQDS